MKTSNIQVGMIFIVNTFEMIITETSECYITHFNKYVGIHNPLYNRIFRDSYDQAESLFSELEPHSTVFSE